MSSPDRPRILFVDDDEAMRHALSRALGYFFEVTQAADGVEATAILERHDFDAVVTDLEMPRLGGDGLVTWIGAHRPDLVERVIVVTGGAKRTAQLEWLQAFDSTRVLAKPADVDVLVQTITHVIDRGRP